MAPWGRKTRWIMCVSTTRHSSRAHASTVGQLVEFTMQHLGTRGDLNTHNNDVIDSSILFLLFLILI